MKKYISEKITKITLNEKQSILQTCMIGGLYLNTQSPPWCGSNSGGPGPRCDLTPKGATAVGTSMDTATVERSSSAS